MLEMDIIVLIKQVLRFKHITGWQEIIALFPKIVRLHRTLNYNHLVACLDKFDPIYKEECDGEDFWRENYFYDHETKQCTLFWYNGCHGLSTNIFSQLSSCENLCEKSNVLKIAGRLKILKVYSNFLPFTKIFLEEKFFLERIWREFLEDFIEKIFWGLQFQEFELKISLKIRHFGVAKIES